MSTAAAEPAGIARSRTSPSSGGSADGGLSVEPSTEPLTRRWLIGAGFVALIMCLLQSPGLTVADTKYDLTENPIGFLARAAHQWNSQAPLGQVQNQAYGYFFPHGAFFAFGELLHIPPWITQRFWWALLIVAGFWGVIRVAEALGIGSRSSRIIAAVAFALSPRVLTTIGSISSESLPMMLAPWVLLPVILATRPAGPGSRSLGRLAAQSALAVALMGAVNAVATAAACMIAGLWWIAHRPNRRWWVFTAWWIPCLLLATLWWIVPLLLLGRVSPPFLDYIESSGVTTQWTSLTEVLRGTDSWTPFVSPERVAGTVLVTQPVAVVATGLIAAAGLAGLCMRSMPAKGRLTLILLVGIAGLGAGYVGELGSPIAEQVRAFLDGTGAPLRNVHKLEPLVRLPLVLGLAHLLAKVPLPGSVPLRRWRSAFAHPEREPILALTSLLLVALTLTTSLAWSGRLAPRGAYDEVPSYWHDAAQWLEDNAAGSGGDGSGADAERALVVPGAPFGSQVWGLTRDEPLQPLASTPWAVRDAVPLVPPGAIRALDSVQRLISDGRPSDGLADTLLAQGIRYVVVRNDLDPETSRSARPLLVHQTVDGSPGFEKVAQFGDDIAPETAEDVVVDGDLRPGYPAIEIYRVTAPGAPTPPAGPYTVDLDPVPVVQGGPESLLRLAENGTVTGPALLATDAARAGIDAGSVTVTDTPTDRETDFGQVDNHSSALRGPDDPRRTYNAVPDYPVPDAPLVHGEWSGATITVSSAASDATQLGGTAPGSGPAATVDGDPATAWLSNGLETARGQWLRLDFDTPITRGMLHLTTSPAAFGPPVKWLRIETPNGSTSVKVDKPGKPVDVSLPSGTTPWLRILATHTEDGSPGFQFGISDLTVDDYSSGTPVPVPIVHRTVLPPTPDGAAVRGWDLGQELPGRSGCAEGPDRVHCSGSLVLPPEEPGTFTRTLSVPEAAAVTPELTLRPRPGAALEALVADPGAVSAHGPSDGVELRGTAGAAVDGDVATSWTAPSETAARAKGKGGLPTLTIRLPQPTLVTGLTVTPSPGNLPASPSRVAVNLGDGPQTRDLDNDEDPSAPQTISLEPHVTDTIVLTLVRWHEVLDRTALGFLQLQPAGLSEVVALGEDGRPVPGTATAAADRTVTVGCDVGPTISIGGTLVRTSVTATTEQLAAGLPVTATPCAPAVPAALPAGRQDVVVAPGPAFTVDSLRLDAAPAAPAAAPASPTVGRWTENLRELDVAAADTDQLLVVPESTNSGWIATAPDGTELQPVIVSGWQQGWIVPAGTDGVVTLEFPTDRWYRAGIAFGLALLIPLLLLALVPRRRTRDLGPTPRPWRSVVAASFGVVAVATVVAGPVGTLVTVLVAAAALGLSRWRGPSFAARVLVGVAGVSSVLAAVLLSTGPWRAADGYVGHSFLIQLFALIGVVCVGVSALPLSRSPMWRRLSQRWTARRDGSSTNA
ncbi:alpha-(1-_3)-arabinofuranosyltransferase domain-containing protein [Rhodococcus sp. TAF43]|uniref:alpha-(1->3)-arabinofuranosyltransferase domain-containing protein n=1 Tax=Rhodococcus sp. TAF43 TaxID=3237483 RepID=UPI003F9E9563